MLSFVDPITLPPEGSATMARIMDANDDGIVEVSERRKTPNRTIHSKRAVDIDINAGSLRVEG